VALAVAAGGGLAVATSAPAAASVGTARFVPLPPARILDTRDGTGGVGGRLAAGGTVTLPVAGRGGVPASGAVAVAFNLTAVDSAAAGFFTASPSGEPRPVVSNLNVTARGRTVANLVVVRLGANGAVDLFSQTGGDLVVDVAGYWTSAAASAGGRFVALKPVRLLDTRTGNGASGALGAGASIDLQVAGREGLPATGIGAVVLNVTATDAAAPGFVSAWPTGGARPLASVLNLPGAGATVPNLVVVPLGAGGRVSLFSQTGTHLVADVAGWFTADGGAAGTDGLFVPLSPSRVLDTRASGIVEAGRSRALPLGGAGGVPVAGVGGVVLNVTGTDAVAAGYVTVYPADTAAPLASNLNLPGAGATAANAVFAALGHGSAIRLFSQSGTHVVVDVAGYFLGTPVVQEIEAVVTRRRPATPEAFACNPVNGVGAERIDINPGLAEYLTAAVTPAMTQQAFRDVTYTVAYYSGPFPALVASYADWDRWVDERHAAQQGPFTIADVYAAVATAYHEVIHYMQAPNRYGPGVRCLPVAPGGGHRWNFVGFDQLDTRADVDARIDALVTDAFLRDTAHSVARVYLSNELTPGIADQGFESQLWEVSAYVLELEWENRFGNHLAANGLGSADNINVLVTASKLHQLARYLYRAQVLGFTDFSGLQTAEYQGIVADLWNIGVANWRMPPFASTALARQTWTLAFGPDAATVAAFAPGRLAPSPPQP
jgi:hypothetical protein